MDRQLPFQYQLTHNRSLYFRLQHTNSIPDRWNALRQHMLTLLPFVDKTSHHLSNFITLFFCTFTYARKSWEPDWLNVLSISQCIPRQ
jgi:hypothetical protein